MKKCIIDNVSINTPFSWIEDGYLVISGSKIEQIGDKSNGPGTLTAERDSAAPRDEADEVFDGGGNTLLPGFIDIHTHGALGRDYSSDPDLIFDDAPFRASRGVTAFLPTVGCFRPPEEMLQSAAELARIIRAAGQKSSQKEMRGARPLGINMEGPFLHPELGAQDKANCFWEFDAGYLDRLLGDAGDVIKIMTVSPELAGTVEGIRVLRDAGIIPAIGHTLAEDALLDRAIGAGAMLATHLLNTTYQPEQEIKGVVKTGVNEYLMIRDDIIAEFICDSAAAHINPVMLEILFRCKGLDKLIMISDSVLSPGLEQGVTIPMPDGRAMVMREGVNYNLEDNHITGSGMTIDGAVRSLLDITARTLPEASIMASLNPARLLGLENRKGSIEPGKDADVIVVDREMNVTLTVVEGQLVYKRG